MSKDNRYELLDGDEIGLLWRKNAELNCREVLFGLRISYFDEKNAPIVPQDDFKPEHYVPKLAIERKNSVSFTSIVLILQKDSTPERKTRNTNPDVGAAEQLSFAEMNIELTAVEGRRGVDRAMKVKIIKETCSHSQKWTPEEEEKLLRIMDSGETHSWKDVALHFPLRSPDAVRNKYKKMMDVAPHRKKQKTAPKETFVPVIVQPIPTVSPSTEISMYFTKKN